MSKKSQSLSVPTSNQTEQNLHEVEFWENEQVISVINQSQQIYQKICCMIFQNRDISSKKIYYFADYDENLPEDSDTLNDSLQIKQIQFIFPISLNIHEISQSATSYKIILTFKPNLLILLMVISF